MLLQFEPDVIPLRPRPTPAAAQTTLFANVFNAYSLARISIGRFHEVFSAHVIAIRSGPVRPQCQQHQCEAEQA
jgi:hypothetical protein